MARISETQRRRSESMKKIWAQRSKKKREAIAKKISKKTSAQMERQWADPKWHKKMKKVRQEQGKKPENIKKLSKGGKRAWRRKEYRQKVMGTRQQTMYSNPEWKKKVSKSFFKKGGHSWNAGHTKETHPTLTAFSERLRGQIPNWSKYGQYYRGKHGKIWMRSGWEVGYAKWMDQKGINWEYEPVHFIVGKGPWAGETYTPDFFIPDKDLWLDVKGYLSEENAAKIKAFRKRRPDLKFRLVEYKELRTLGIITPGGYKK
jgi:endonuclease I